MYARHHHLGFTVITVALDQNAADARPYIERAAPQHPSLIDTEHLVADLYGMINIPTMVWIDETGRIVRPNDVAVTNDLFKDFTGLESGPRMQALTSWIVDGSTAGEPDQVRAQLMMPTADEQLARAEFTLAWHLHKQRRDAAATAHLEQAGRLSPHDWTIRRAGLRIRGIDPMASLEMADLMSECHHDSQRRRGRF